MDGLNNEHVQNTNSCSGCEASPLPLWPKPAAPSGGCTHQYQRAFCSMTLVLPLACPKPFPVAHVGMEAEVLTLAHAEPCSPPPPPSDLHLLLPSRTLPQPHSFSGPLHKLFSLPGSFFPISACVFSLPLRVFTPRPPSQ